MIETKECFSCGQLVSVINCHYQCSCCGYSENWHDISERFVLKKDKEVVKKGKKVKSREKIKELHTEEVW